MIDTGLVAATVLHLFTREWLAIAAFGIAVSSLDDLVIDTLFFGRWSWRRHFIYRRHDRACAEDLVHADPGWMAIIVPAWDEAAVIGTMLADLTARLDYPHYRVFVGVYPNDAATLAAVTGVGDDRIAPVVCRLPGPTTKADCLNHLWRALLADEVAAGRRFKGIVLHDAEDVVHALELSVYDHLLGTRLAMVQLPVVPLIDHTSRWVAGHYLDEFAELHTKDIVVRETLGAAVPSAGVACAIDRDMLARIAALAPDGSDEPFDATCLTEDYELGIKIKRLGGRGAMVRIRCRATGEIVATREHFPATLDTALRQKTRWLLGIALSGWDRIGWHGGLTDRFMLVRDRKAIVAALLTLAGYAAVLLVSADTTVRYIWPQLTRQAPLVAPGSLLELLLAFNVFVLGWRLLMRALYTGYAHGPREGVRAIPRALIGNVINAAAALRACRRYLRIAQGREANYWDKTAHRFPQAAE